MSHACGLEPAQDPRQLICSKESGAFNPHRLQKKKRDEVSYLCMCLCVCVYQLKIVTHSKLIIRVHFPPSHRSGILEALNVVGFVKAKNKRKTV